MRKHSKESIEALERQFKIGLKNSKPYKDYGKACIQVNDLFDQRFEKPEEYKEALTNKDKMLKRLQFFSEHGYEGTY